MATAVADGKNDLNDLKAVSLSPMNLLKNYKGIEEDEARASKKYYAQYGSKYSVKNLSWSADLLLNMCKEPLRNMILEILVGVNPMEMGRPLVLKLMLDIIMDVNGSALQSITQSLQKLRLKDVPGENVCTAVSYLKGALLLLHHLSST